MRNWFSTLCFLMAGLGFMGTSVAAEADVSAADAKSVRAVIQAQFDALAVDDAKAAFALAAPNLREMFGSPDDFIDMVRTSYPVVYRPVSVACLRPEQVAENLFQGVHLTDGDGNLWLAMYRMVRQRDKSWRIAGCHVVHATGQVS